MYRSLFAKIQSNAVFAIFYVDILTKIALLLFVCIENEVFSEKKAENCCVVKNKAVLLQRQTREVVSFGRNSSLAQSVRASDC